MFDRKRNIIFFKFLIIILNLILIIILIDRTLSKYETTATSQLDIQAAFYLLQEDYQTMTVKLSALEPKNNAYSYTFVISNNNGSRRAETTLEYDLKIVTTTNLPLEYELYKNGDNSSSIITDDTIAPDEYGTFFRTFSTEMVEFVHTENKSNIYTLLVYFPEQYKEIKYQDIIESIEIQVNSRQLIEEDNQVEESVT